MKYVIILQTINITFTGNHALYRIGSGKKGSGNEFLGENNNKNDYDWYVSYWHILMNFPSIINLEHISIYIVQNFISYDEEVMLLYM